MRPVSGLARVGAVRCPQTARQIRPQQGSVNGVTSYHINKSGCADQAPARASFKRQGRFTCTGHTDVTQTTWSLKERASPPLIIPDG